MIYLIDDKRERQAELLKDKSLLQDDLAIIKSIYTKDELDLFKKLIFEANDKSIILFHDSFFENAINRHEKQPDIIRQDLINFANNGKSKVVFFSGGTHNRIIVNDNLAYMPVGVLYRNLKFFVSKVKESDDQLRFLAFGPNHKFESVFIYRNKIWDILFMDSPDSIVKGKDELFNNLELLLKEVNANALITEFERDILDKGISTGYLKYKINRLIINYLHG